ncbi:MAG: hypothetical protein HY896_09990 [Deltaproteobacteria bacterium]|nr:hypothetical protein [Deltaproteobacteria bacterium]
MSTDKPHLARSAILGLEAAYFTGALFGATGLILFTSMKSSADFVIGLAFLGVGMLSQYASWRSLNGPSTDRFKPFGFRGKIWLSAPFAGLVLVLLLLVGALGVTSPAHWILPCAFVLGSLFFAFKFRGGIKDLSEDRGGEEAATSGKKTVTADGIREAPDKVWSLREFPCLADDVVGQRVEPASESSAAEAELHVEEKVNDATADQGTDERRKTVADLFKVITQLFFTRDGNGVWCEAKQLSDLRNGNRIENPLLLIRQGDPSFLLKEEGGLETKLLMNKEGAEFLIRNPRAFDLFRMEVGRILSALGDEGYFGLLNDHMDRVEDEMTKKGIPFRDVVEARLKIREVYVGLKNKFSCE